MQENTFNITGYGSHDSEDGTRQTVQFDYQIDGTVYSTEHFLDIYGDPPSADELTTGLQNWIETEAVPQLTEEQIVPADLEALITEG